MPSCTPARKEFQGGWVKGESRQPGMSPSPFRLLSFAALPPSLLTKYAAFQQKEKSISARTRCNAFTIIQCIRCVMRRDAMRRARAPAGLEACAVCHILSLSAFFPPPSLAHRFPWPSAAP